MISLVHYTLLYSLEVMVTYVIEQVQGCPNNIDLEIWLFCLLKI